jgi:hypothetical protein
MSSQSYHHVSQSAPSLLKSPAQPNLGKSVFQKEKVFFYFIKQRSAVAVNAAIVGLAPGTNATIWGIFSPKKWRQNGAFNSKYF